MPLFEGCNDLTGWAEWSHLQELAMTTGRPHYDQSLMIAVVQTLSLDYKRRGLGLRQAIKKSTLAITTARAKTPYSILLKDLSPRALSRPHCILQYLTRVTPIHPQTGRVPRFARTSINHVSRVYHPIL